MKTARLALTALLATCLLALLAMPSCSNDSYPGGATSTDPMFEPSSDTPGDSGDGSVDHDEDSDTE
jgi:hypothetical protein